MLWAVLSAEGWTIVIGAVFLGVGQITQIVLAYFREKRKEERDEATKAAVAAVKDTLANTTDTTTAKLDEGLKIGRATHTLVNEKSSVTLRRLRDRSKKLYDRDPSEENRRDLEADEEALQDHLRQQALV